MTDEQATPPRFASGLLALLLPPEERGAVLGDLAEEFQEIAVRDGAARARAWFRLQVVRSLVPTVRRRAWRRRSGFGGPRAPTLDTRGRMTMEGLVRDVRYSLRRLARHPGYVAAAVATLGLAIGGTAALWTVVHATLLRPLPFEDGEELVWFWHDYSWTAPEILHMRGRWDGFDGVAGFTTQSVTFRVPEGPTSHVSAVRASEELFAVLGRGALRGRTFRAGDDAPGAPPVVVLSHALWESEFGAAPDVVGRPVVLDGESHTVVGIMPEDFFFPERTSRLWFPRVDPENGSGQWSLVGRLPDGRALADMEPVLGRVTTILGEAFEYENPTWDRTRNPRLHPLRDRLVGDVRPALWLTLGAVVMILLMACANVSGLALARTRSREHELSVRTALGADRVRLARQLLVEALAVGLLAGAAGAAFAALSFAGLVGSLPLTEPLSEGLAIDAGTYLGAFSLSLVASLLISVGPIVVALRGEPRSPGTSRTVTRAGRLERGLVVIEMAVAVVLIAGAGLLVRSVRALERVDPGFEPEGLVDVRLTMGSADFEAAERSRLLDRLGERLEALPGVRSVGAVQVPPLWGKGWNFGLRIEGREDDPTSTLFRVVTEDYFETVGLEVLRGRGFGSMDVAESGFVTVVNEAFVREYLAGEEPLGTRLNPGLADGWSTIVGVVEDEALGDLRDPFGPTRYVLGRQFEWAAESNALMVAVDGAIPTAALRSAVADVDSRIAISHIEPMSHAYRRAMGRTGQLVHLLGALGFFGVLLGAIGIYGVVSHFVSRRRREWGIRLALGQSPGRVISHVIGNATGLVVLGVSLGLLGAWVGTRSLGSLLYGVPPTDGLAFLGAAAALLATGLVAAALPAFRAARVDPVVSLRAD